MLKVYIAHPYNGKQENMDSVTTIARGLKNILPISPIHAFSFLEEPQDRTKALEYCRELLSMCDELWLCPGWERSEGCRMEKAWAKDMGIKVVII